MVHPDKQWQYIALGLLWDNVKMENTCTYIQTIKNSQNTRNKIFKHI